MSYKSGFAAIVGRANAGKSTLLNALVKQKVSIVSQKPQTTRNNILGIITKEEYQIIFVDTPGIHSPKNKLDNFMQSSINSAVRDVDAVIYTVDGHKSIPEFDIDEIKRLCDKGLPVIVAVTKTDITQPEKLIPELDKLNGIQGIEVVAVSAWKNRNVEILENMVAKLMPDGVMLYPEDMVTDKSERFMASELIREIILRNYQNEIPHGVGVSINKMRRNPQKNIFEIDADIICEKPTHKSILIGKNGDALKATASSARMSLEHMLESKVFLTLWVRIKDDWRDSDFMLKEIGYDKNQI